MNKAQLNKAIINLGRYINNNTFNTEEISKEVKRLFPNGYIEIITPKTVIFCTGEEFTGKLTKKEIPKFLDGVDYWFEDVATTVSEKSIVSRLEICYEGTKALSGAVPTESIFTIIKEVKIKENKGEKTKMNNGFTEMELQVLNALMKEDGNGEFLINSNGGEQYLTVLNIDINHKQLRGVLGSLVKKGYLTMGVDENDSFISITDKYRAYMEEKDVQFTTIPNDPILCIKDIIEELRETSSTNEKIKILEKNKNNVGLKNILEMTYNPHKKYGIATTILEDNEVSKESAFTSLQELTDTLAKSNINNELRKQTKRFLLDADDYYLRELYKDVLTKDLKIGVNTQTINKVWKGLIPTSETGVTIKSMLASKFNFDKPPVGEFVVTEKLDGIRCLAICKKDNIELYTRQGKLIQGCVEIEKDLKELVRECGEEFVLDGELLADDCSYEDVYKETTKRVKNKNEIKTGIHFTVFDVLEIEEFENLDCKTKYYDRLMKLLTIQTQTEVDSKITFIKPLYRGSNIDTLLSLLETYKEKGAEGLMVNLMDSNYEFKRSKTLLKVKVMQTADLRIVGFEEGQGKHSGKLGAVLVEYKNNIVKVGSGFSDAEREYIWDNKQDYIEKIAEVQYFEETKNKEGGLSLRFPVWKHLRADKTEPSYF